MTGQLPYTTLPFVACKLCGCDRNRTPEDGGCPDPADHDDYLTGDHARYDMVHGDWDGDAA